MEWLWSWFASSASIEESSDDDSSEGFVACKCGEQTCTTCVPPGQWKGTVDENGVPTGESFYKK